MSTPHEDTEADLEPTLTPGYNPGGTKSAKELTKLDAGDESLTRWKASLGLVPGADAPANGPKLTVLMLELKSSTLPPGKKIALDLTDPLRIEANTKKNPIIIKEGVEYNVRIEFKVNHDIVSGLKYIQVVKASGVPKLADKMEKMLGSYGPNPEGKPYEKNFDKEESPSGLIARMATYTVRSRVIDDDGEIYADWKWNFKLAKEWE